MQALLLDRQTVLGIVCFPERRHLWAGVEGGGQLEPRVVEDLGQVMACDISTRAKGCAGLPVRTLAGLEG